MGALGVLMSYLTFQFKSYSSSYHTALNWQSLAAIDWEQLWDTEYKPTTNRPCMTANWPTSSAASQWGCQGELPQQPTQNIRTWLVTANILNFCPTFQVRTNEKAKASTQDACCQPASPSFLRPMSSGRSWPELSQVFTPKRAPWRPLPNTGDGADLLATANWVNSLFLLIFGWASFIPTTQTLNGITGK